MVKHASSFFLWFTHWWHRLCETDWLGVCKDIKDILKFYKNELKLLPQTDNFDGPEVREESASFANMDFAVTTPNFPRVLFQLQVHTYIVETIVIKFRVCFVWRAAQQYLYGNRLFPFEFITKAFFPWNYPMKPYLSDLLFKRCFSSFSYTYSYLLT